MPVQKSRQCFFRIYLVLVRLFLKFNAVGHLSAGCTGTRGRGGVLEKSNQTMHGNPSLAIQAIPWNPG